MSVNCVCSAERYTPYIDQEAYNDFIEDKPIQPLFVEITSTPQLDPTRREYYKAENRERDSSWRKRRHWTEISRIIASGILALLTLLTLSQIRKQTPCRY